MLISLVCYSNICNRLSETNALAHRVQTSRKRCIFDIIFMIGFSLKSNESDFEIVNFPFLDGDVPRSPSYGVYISQLIRFARVCSNIDDFNNRTLFMTTKLLKQDIIKFEKHFLNSTTDTQS